MLTRHAAHPGEIVLLPTVQGLATEVERVRRAFAEVRPAAVALGVSPEHVEGLSRYEPDPEVDLFEDLTEHDAAYSVCLERYGPVDLPPPDLLAAVELARGYGLPFHGVDLPEAAYEDAFTKLVGTWSFLRYGRLQRRLARRPPRAPDAQSFALAWDRKVRRIKAIARVERLRETAIADNAAALAARVAGPVLLVVEVARAEGVRARLDQRLGATPAQP